MKRYSELDALRGIAALVVVCRHFVNVFPREQYPLLDLIANIAPTRAFLAAHEAVLLFFLLSGFVLSMSLESGRQTYPIFLWRRVCRIWPPYAAAVGIAALGAFFLNGTVPGTSGWFALTWTQPVTWGVVGQHLLLIGKFDTAQLNTAFWSLIYEMRISLVFPLMWIVTQRGPLWLAASLALLGTLIASVTLASPFDADWTMTFHYMGIFALGAVAARHRDWLCAAYLRIPPKLRIAGHGLAALTIPYGLGPHFVRDYLGYFTEWVVVGGLLWFLVAALSGGAFSRFLNGRIPQYLGHVSYSLYLVHGTVLFALVHVLPMWAVAVLYLPLSFGLAALFRAWIEGPSIKLGRRGWGRTKPVAAA